MIGATAFPIHGYARPTHEVDEFTEPAEESALRMMSALRAIGDDASDLTVEDPRGLERFWSPGSTA